MCLLETKQGNVIVSNIEDLERLIDDNIGYDAARFFNEKLNEKFDSLTLAADYTSQKVNTDIDAYEAEIESNTAAFSDVLDCVKVLSDLLENKTLSSDKISYQLRQIKTIISNQI